MEWRRATILVSAVAALEFVLLAAAAVALLGNPLSGHFKAEAAAAAAPLTRKTEAPSPKKQPALPRNDVSVIVLNAGGRSGAAAVAAAQVRSRGYLVASVGNTAHQAPTHTLVMYRPGFAAEAARFARDLHIRVVSPLDGMRPAELMGAHLVMLVG